MALIDKETIRKEIERRMMECHEHFHDRASSYAWEAQFYAYKGFLAFLDQLEAEQPTLPAGLEEAAEKYAEEVALCDEVPSISYYKMVFKAGVGSRTWKVERRQTERM